LVATLIASNGSTLTANISSTGIVSGTWVNANYNLSGSLTGIKKLTEISSSYIGSFDGTYSDGDTGTWTIIVAKDGSITGSTTSTKYGGTYSVSGTLNGNIANVTATSGSTLTATILSDGIVSGTWINTTYNLSGSLSGSKNATEISSSYIGIFSETYSGEDSGTWIITVSTDGTITGSATSTKYGGTYSASGTLSGTWINEDYSISGNLTGSKNIS